MVVFFLAAVFFTGAGRAGSDRLRSLRSPVVLMSPPNAFLAEIWYIIGFSCSIPSKSWMQNKILCTSLRDLCFHSVQSFFKDTASQEGQMGQSATRLCNQKVISYVEVGSTEQHETEALYGFAVVARNY